MEKIKGINIRRTLVTAFIILFGIITYINFKGSYLEYYELGENYLQTFLTKQIIKYSVMVINFIVIYIIMYFYGRKIKKGLKIFFEQEKKHMPKLPNKSIALITASIESIFIQAKITPSIILLISNTSFGNTDPLFNFDLSFFMFVEPMLKMAALYFVGICVAMIIYSFGYYVVVFNKYFDGIEKETLIKSPIMKTIYRNIRLIAIGLAFYIAVCSMDVVFDNFLTTDNNIKLAGAGFIDSTVKCVGYCLLAIILLASIFKAVHSMKKGKQVQILKDLSVVPIYLVILFFVMLGVDLIFVYPNEFDKEKSYIEYNISATRNAYGIDCDNENIEYTGTVTVNDVENNENIINNTVILSKDMVLNNLEETQASTGYYTYKTAKLNTYEIDGIKKLAYVSPREILNSRRTYNSKTYEYTHGYGLIYTSATEFNENGEIKYIQNDIDGSNEIIKINTPQIYYGLETNTTVVTNAKNKKEFDYANEEAEYEIDYEGNAGLKLGFLDRLVLGLKQKNIKLALSSSVTTESKLLINRNIIKRAKIALPDVMYDENPYTVVDENGDIYWVVDAYTVSSSYPYSTYTDIEYTGQKRSINYIRNSIKVIINSYTGEMKFYITDRTDPIAMAYRKVYPEIFENLESEIPESIRNQFIYPEFLYKVQSTMLEEYHNSKADVLYRSDDTWQKANYKNSQNTKKGSNVLDAYYTMIKSGDEEKIGLIQMYTQKNKQNITSYLLGTVEDGKNMLVTKTLYSDTSILGPNQLDNQISQDEGIQKEIDSLTVTGSRITKNMIIVPVDNTLLYIEPIYQTLLNENNLVALKKVVVASGNKVAIGNTTKEAVENLISQYATKIDIDSVDNKDDLIESIIKANDNLSDSLSSNNWDLMGSDIQKLQSLINVLKKEYKPEKDKVNTETDSEVDSNLDLDSIKEDEQDDGNKVGIMEKINSFVEKNTENRTE